MTKYYDDTKAFVLQEKILLAVCVGTLFIVVNIFIWGFVAAMKLGQIAGLLEAMQ